MCHRLSEPLLRLRLGEENAIETLEYGEKRTINGVELSLHPAGHIIGSAQVRLAYKGEVWVISGDYKLGNDGISTPFEPVQCHHFVTESTFGLPIYKFPEATRVAADLNQWLQQNDEEGVNSLLVGYSLGKAQRIIESIADKERPIYAHGAVFNVQQRLRESGSKLRSLQHTRELDLKKTSTPSVIVMPPSAVGTSWTRRFRPSRIAYFSGWMQLRGARRRRNVDRGFVLSDHADWHELNQAVRDTGAEHIYVTHGYRSIFARWIRDQYALDAREVEAAYDDDLLNTEDADETL